jgi:hypothetical protein
MARYPLPAVVLLGEALFALAVLVLALAIATAWP